ncbi:MAG TPA: hypothetical protein VFY05_11290 [Candidatus Angelobacter sp.]|nr:hypothetical protein [Candidatus Angelobacter sp.]
MKRNLILSLVLLAFSIPNLAFAAPKPCTDAGKQSSVQKKTKVHKQKEKKPKENNQMQDSTGFNG